MSKKNYCNNYKIGTNLIRNEQIENIMGSTKMYEKKGSQVMGKDSSFMDNPSPNGPRT